MTELFDPDKYLAESEEQTGFDPDQYLAGNQEPAPLASVKSKTKREKLTTLQSGMAGLSQGASLGFADELVGGINAALDVAIDTVMRPGLTEEQQKYLDSPEFSAAYKTERDRIRAKIRQAAKDNPAAFIAGEIGGSIASTAIPGRLAAQAAGNLAKAVRAASGTVGTGAVAGAGFSEAEELTQVAKDAAKGAAVGAALGKVGGAVARQASKAGRSAARELLKERNMMGVKGNIVDAIAVGTGGLTGLAASRLGQGAVGRFRSVASRLKDVGSKNASTAPREPGAIRKAATVQVADLLSADEEKHKKEK